MFREQPVRAFIQNRIQNREIKQKKCTQDLAVTQLFRYLYNDRRALGLHRPAYSSRPALSEAKNHASGSDDLV